ncbi:MAG: hypothetical protein QM668_16850 [Agriterribacter sp.]
MKQQNEVNSKAGTLKRKTSMINLYGKISKAASMLLIAVTGFGMMSFTQDDTSVNSVDTNLNIKKEAVAETTVVVTASEACCGVTVAKPGDEVKKAYYISMPATHMFLKADREAVIRFEAELFAKKLWSMDIADAAKKADTEMFFNFNVSNMVPPVTAGVYADAEMIINFTDDIVKVANFTALQVNAADNEVIDNFIAEHFSIKAFNPSANLIAGADAEITRAFEKANLPFISMPSQIAANNADVEMIQHYQAEVKSAQTLATK